MKLTKHILVMTPVPVPPNKEADEQRPTKKQTCQSPLDDEDGINISDPVDQSAQDAASGAASASQAVYASLPQTANDLDSASGFNGNGDENGDGDDDDDEDDDEDDESDFELDEDEDFQLLASSRAYQPMPSDATATQAASSGCTPSQRLSRAAEQPATQQELLRPSHYTFDTDVFERRNALECEEIALDEAKSRQISSLMSQFKLPDQCIPDWAKVVPEQVWKKNLIDSLSAKKTDLFDLKSHETTGSSGE